MIKLLGGDENREETEEESAPEGMPKAKKVCPDYDLRILVPPTPELEVKEEEEEGSFSYS